MLVHIASDLAWGNGAVDLLFAIEPFRTANIFLIG
jgi:hypothetical protein